MPRYRAIVSSEKHWLYLDCSITCLVVCTKNAHSCRLDFICLELIIIKVNVYIDLSTIRND